MIPVKDVIDFGNRWFDTVASGGSAQEQAAFFRDPHAQICDLERRDVQLGTAL
jgi:hypothetical protein